MTRRLLCLSTGTAALSVAAVLFAQNPPEKIPVAVVNIQRVALECAPGKKIVEDWKAFEDSARKGFELKAAELKKISGILSGEKAPPAPQRAVLVARKEALEGEIESIKSEYQSRGRRVEAAAEKLTKEAEKLLKEYAKERGIAVVLNRSGEQRDNSLFVIDPAVDITEELLKRMEKVKIDLGGSDAAPMDTGTDAKPQVAFETSMGSIVIELDREKAPLTVANFLRYVEARHYDGTIFHRVIADFVIQGGGYTEKFDEKPTRDPVRNEARNGLKNLRGTLSMARTNDIHSATSQFFINTRDNAALDHQDAGNFGYAVFGKVIKGMDVVDAIRVVKTGKLNTPDGVMSDVPVTPVVLKSARRLNPPAAKDEKKDESKEEKK
jgi:cyclophilin family peptidyl-prolyl cis-trans isomerase/Skp family chaperone for outer membrane proteins